MDKIGEHDGENLAIMIDKMDFKSLGDEGCQVVVVFAVLGRKEDAVDAHPLGRNHFLLDASHRENFSRQRDFARHGHVLPDRLVHRQREHGRDDGASRARSVFWSRSLERIENGTDDFFNQTVEQIRNCTSGT